VTVISRGINPSPDLATARARHLAGVQAWAYACIDRYRSAPATDVHDQGTYATAWAPYVEATGDRHVTAFLKALRDQIRDHFVATDQWRHGYRRAQEAHHGTEHLELFLGTLYRLDPEDAETKAQLMDAVEHIGNWVPGIPRWFDEETGLFRSMYLGTEVVRTEPGMNLNVPDQLRLVNLGLLAHDISGEDRYLAFADIYARRWADAIVTCDQLPIGLTPEGPITTMAGTAEKAYRSFAGMAGHLDDDIDRAENLLASNGTGALLSLWTLTGEAIYREAVERVLDVLATQLDDADAGPAADALRTYRRTTGDDHYDAAILAAYDTCTAQRDPFAIREMGIEPDVRRLERPHGVGKRADMPNWFENGAPRLHNPITLSVVAEIRGDAGLATRALDLARTYLELARKTLPDGRHHGCAANTVSAVARGHGRNNHAGAVTAVGKLTDG